MVSVCHHRILVVCLKRQGPFLSGNDEQPKMARRVYAGNISARLLRIKKRSKNVAIPVHFLGRACIPSRTRKPLYLVTRLQTYARQPTVLQINRKKPKVLGLRTSAANQYKDIN